MMTQYQLDHPREPNEKINTKHFIYHENYGISYNLFSKRDKFIITAAFIGVIAMLVAYLTDDEEARNKANMEEQYLQDFKEHWEEVKDSGIPLAVWWTPEGISRDSLERQCGDVTCNIIQSKMLRHIGDANISAYLFYATSINRIKKTENVIYFPYNRKESDLWILFHEESSRNVEELYIDAFLKMFNYSSTFSRYSDLPFPLHHIGKVFNEELTSTKYFVKTAEKNKLLEEIAPVLYLQSSCDSQSQRDDYVKELMKHIEVDSYGECLNNKKQPKTFEEDYLNQMSRPDFLDFVARYKFTIAIENGICNDYVTEKFWRPIHVGSVPIYFGSPQIKDWLPNNKSAILLPDYPTPEIMANYLKTLLANDTLYEEHLEHKIKGLVSNPRIEEELNKHPYQLTTANLVSEFECFACKKIHDVMDKKVTSRTIERSHYDCPVPVSALTFKIDPDNPWVYKVLEMRHSRFVKQLRKSNDSF